MSRRDPNDILIGAVKSYVTFDYASTSVTKSDNASAEVNGTTYTRGTEYDITSGTDVYQDGEQYVQMQKPFTEIQNSQFVNVQEQSYNYTLNPLTDTYIYPVGGMSSTANTLNTGGAKNFYVEPMTAKSVVFNLKYYREDNKDERPGGSSGETMANLGLDKYFNEGEEYPVTLRPQIENDYLAEPYEVEDYGVGTSLMLPWS